MSFQPILSWLPPCTGLAKNPMMVCVRTVLKNGVFSMAVSTLICWSEGSAENFVAVGNICVVCACSSAMPFVYCGWLFLAKVESALSMKLMTRASRAPGVSSVGMIWAAIGLDLHGLIGREELEADRLARLRSPQHVFFGGKNARVVRRDPGAAQARRGFDEKASSGFSSGAHGVSFSV